MTDRYRQALEGLRERCAQEAKRDRILGARVREIARQHTARSYAAGLDLCGFVWEVMRAMEESDG